jgi:hypothetical protein
LLVVPEPTIGVDVLSFRIFVEGALLLLNKPAAPVLSAVCT